MWWMRSTFAYFQLIPFDCGLTIFFFHLFRLRYFVSLIFCWLITIFSLFSLAIPFIPFYGCSIWLLVVVLLLLLSVCIALVREWGELNIITNKEWKKNTSKLNVKMPLPVEITISRIHHTTHHTHTKLWRIKETRYEQLG